MDELIFRVVKQLATAEEVEAVRLWRQTSLANEQRYRQLAEVLALTKLAESSRRRSSPPPVGEIIHEAATRQFPDPYAFRHRRWLVPLGAAALVLLGFLGSLVLPTRDPAPMFAAEEFVTGTSDMATVRLTDGTVVRLAPSSRLRVTRGSGGREVSLEGHAYFAVAKSKGRTFAVRTRAGDAEVLGTRFEINVKEKDLRLVVVEGLVALSAGSKTVAVPARHMSRVINGDARPAVDVSDAAAQVRWTGRLLVFQERRLTDALEEIEQQYGAQVELADPSLADETVTAWFQDRSFEDVMNVVCAVLNARCNIEPGRATVTGRQSARVQDPRS